jgi:hypothetical protein
MNATIAPAGVIARREHRAAAFHVRDAVRPGGEITAHAREDDARDGGHERDEESPHGAAIARHTVIEKSGLDLRGREPLPCGGMNAIAFRRAVSFAIVMLFARVALAEPLKPTAPGAGGDPVWQRVVHLSDGRTLVTDGGLAIDAALAKPAKLPTGEAGGKTMEGFLARQGTEVSITDLQPAGTTYTAPNGMKLSATYVDYLRRTLGKRVTFRMGGDLDPIVIVAGGKPVGVLMAVRR